MDLNFSIIEPYYPMFLSGLAVTLEVTAAALVLAFALGFVIALLKVAGNRPLRAILDFYTSLFRGIPLIVLLFIAYFATPQITGYKISMFAAAVVTLGLNGSATVSETLRGGIQGVSQGQYDAARSIGMRYVPMMVHVILPQALTYRAFEPFVAIAVVYYVIVMALVAVGRRLERRVRRMQTGEKST